MSTRTPLPTVNERDTENVSAAPRRPSPLPSPSRRRRLPPPRVAPRGAAGTHCSAGPGRPALICTERSPAPRAHTGGRPRCSAGSGLLPGLPPARPASSPACPRLAGFSGAACLLGCRPAVLLFVWSAPWRWAPAFLLLYSFLWFALCFVGVLGLGMSRVDCLDLPLCSAQTSLRSSSAPPGLGAVEASCCSPLS